MTKKPELSDEDRQKLDLAGDLSVEELKSLVSEHKEQLEWERLSLLETISVADLKDQTGSLLDRVLSGEEILVVKKEEMLALLKPYEGEEVDKVYKSTALARQRYKLINEAKKGLRLAIERREKIIALLAPPPKKKMFLLSPEEANFLKVGSIREIPIEELEIIIEDYRDRVKGLEKKTIDIIDSETLRINSGSIIDKVNEGILYLVLRRGVEEALLVPYSGMELWNGTSITSTDVNRNLPSILNEVKAGKKFIVHRNKKPVAAIVQPPLKYRMMLSDEERTNLAIFSELTAEEVRQAVKLLRVVKGAIENE